LRNSGLARLRLKRVGKFGQARERYPLAACRFELALAIKAAFDDPATDFVSGYRAVLFAIASEDCEHKGEGWNDGMVEWWNGG